MFHKTLLLSVVLIGSWLSPISTHKVTNKNKYNQKGIFSKKLIPRPFYMRKNFVLVTAMSGNKNQQKITIMLNAWFKEMKKHKHKHIVQKQIKKKVGTEYIYELTAYTAGRESTGKSPGDKGYGITASGKRVKQGETLSCPPQLKLGTQIYIPYFKRTFVCEDRGNAIKGNRLDVYYRNLNDALKFGRRKLKIYIIK